MKPAREHPYDGSPAEAVRAGFCPVCRGTGSAEPRLAGKGFGPMTCPGCGGCGLWPPRDELDGRRPSYEHRRHEQERT